MNWGETAWEDAIDYPGAVQIGLGAKLLQELPWSRFEPHSEWVSWKNRNSPEKPQSAGIADLIRVMYLPVCDDVTVRGLKANSSHRAFWFDLLTGRRTAIGKINATEKGLWDAPLPPLGGQDWVLVMNEEKP